MEKNKNDAMTQPSNGFSDLLVDYKQLLDEGVLTQEEFNQIKKEVLGLHVCDHDLSNKGAASDQSSEKGDPPTEENETSSQETKAMGAGISEPTYTPSTDVAISSQDNSKYHHSDPTAQKSVPQSADASLAIIGSHESTKDAGKTGNGLNDLSGREAYDKNNTSSMGEDKPEDLKEAKAKKPTKWMKVIGVLVVLGLIICIIAVKATSPSDNDSNTGSTVNTTSQSEQAEKDDKETTDDQNADSNGSGYEDITSGQLRDVLNKRFSSELDAEVTDVSDQTFYGQGYGQLMFYIGSKAAFVRTQINDESYDYDSPIDCCVFFIEKDENAIDCMAIVASSIYDPFTKEAAKEDIISLLDQAEAHKTGSTAQIEWKQYDEWNLLCGDSGDVYCCAVFPAGMKPDEILKMAGVRL